jgi:phytoene dehydrogenase-like protein
MSKLQGLVTGTAGRAAPVVVVGAGLAGLVAASELHRRGVDVLVFEGSPSIAGMASSFHDEKGFKYDSSVILMLKDGTVRPFQLSNGLWEVPVACANDAEGKKIVGYLWPMHENARPPENYVTMFEQFREGLFVLADHSWHVQESYSRGMLSDADAELELTKLRRVLEGALDSGVEFTRIDDHILEHFGEGR